MINIAIYDSWKIKPPCEFGLDCTSKCPYYFDCSNDYEDEDDEDLDDVDDK